jgi:hypothetical protein
MPQNSGAGHLGLHRLFDCTRLYRRSGFCQVHRYKSFPVVGKLRCVLVVTKHSL